MHDFYWGKKYSKYQSSLTEKPAKSDFLYNIAMQYLLMTNLERKDLKNEMHSCTLPNIVIIQIQTNLRYRQ